MEEKTVVVKLKNDLPKTLYLAGAMVTNYRFDAIPFSAAKAMKEAGYKLVQKKNINEDNDFEEETSSATFENKPKEEHVEEVVDENEKNEIDNIVDSAKKNKSFKNDRRQGKNK